VQRCCRTRGCDRENEVQLAPEPYETRLSWICHCAAQPVKLLRKYIGKWQHEAPQALGCLVVRAVRREAGWVAVTGGRAALAGDRRRWTDHDSTVVAAVATG
jgi:hypothetical protein